MKQGYQVRNKKVEQFSNKTGLRLGAWYVHNSNGCIHGRNSNGCMYVHNSNGCIHGHNSNGCMYGHNSKGCMYVTQAPKVAQVQIPVKMTGFHSYA